MHRMRRRVSACVLAMSMAALPALAQTPQGQAQLPPPGTLSANMPPGVEIHMGIFVSDSTQEFSREQGSTAVEARLRARRTCAELAPDCEEVLNFPMRDHCLAVAVNPTIGKGARALFANAAQKDAPQAGTLREQTVAQCQQGGGTCQVFFDYCF